MCINNKNPDSGGYYNTVKKLSVFIDGSLSLADPFASNPSVKTFIAGCSAPVKSKDFFTQTQQDLALYDW